MQLLVKLLIIHFIGDFILQNKAFTNAKAQHKLRSYHLYLHVFLHAGLSWLILWDLKYWPAAVIILITHFLIDWAKLCWTNKKNHRILFTIDQVAHIVILILISSYYQSIDVYWSSLRYEYILPLILCIILLTSPVGIMLQTFFTRWTLPEKKDYNHGLKNAGKWIGMLERLLVFLFIITDNFSAVGFLLAAKSVFRFGDISKSKNMKLTEYVLIGTLLSFGIAIITGLAFRKLYL